MGIVYRNPSFGFHREKHGLGCRSATSDVGRISLIISMIVIGPTLPRRYFMLCGRSKSLKNFEIPG